MLQGNKTVCYLEHWNILLKWMQFSFLENRSLVPRKFQVVENHCSNISCAKSSISTPFLQSSKFAQRFTLQASLSGVSARCRTVRTPLSNSKKMLLVKPLGMGWKNFAISASQPIKNGGLGALCPTILLRALSLCLQCDGKSMHPQFCQSVHSRFSNYMDSSKHWTRSSNVLLFGILCIICFFF